MTKKQFWIRLPLFILFACIIPFVFIAWRYKIFHKVSNVSLSGWGLIGILIVVIFVIYLVKSVEKIKKWSLTKQIFVGVFKIIVPLLCLYFGLRCIKESVDLFMQALIVVIFSEMIAIVINPIPQAQENSEIDYFSQIFKKEGEKE